LFEAAIGVIGGSGFYSMEAVKNPRYREIETPFGNPSEKMLTGEIAGHPVVFLSRHGIGHRYNPKLIIVPICMP
jgi:5'-methylthioadenosine phosphorylase